MNYTTEQITQIHNNIQKIVGYIEENILPHISHSYETPDFGPTETWGRFNEHRGQRYHIELNGPYKYRIRFYHGSIFYDPKDIAERDPEIAVNFLKYWRDAKMYLNTEVANSKNTVELINNFEI
jgi:hypothetical protein